jgi:hypothetical protein
MQAKKMFWLVSCIGIILFELSCNSTPGGKLTSPPGYDLSKPQIYKLPAALDEISGVVYYPKDSSVFAINDERGYLFKIHLTGREKIEKWKYAGGADFEDVVLVDSFFYVLQSDGTLISFKFLSPDSVKSASYALELPGSNEFEILYRNKDQNELILLCKDCQADDKNSLSAYTFNLSTHSFSPKPAYVIDVRKIEALMEQKGLHFKPSAAAVHPVTGELYIVSSVNKLLVISDINGVPSKVFRIDPKLYKQPEGISIGPKGELVISNESADIGAANILFFKYKANN